ncbi:MAG: tyrosine-type recombinase/integrase, partial [Euzebya sp.]
FFSRERKPLNRNYINPKIWKPALVKAGIAPTRQNGMHALRHHFASVMLLNGVAITELAGFLGHGDPAFTLRVYAHMLPDSEERGRAAMDAAWYAGEPSGLREVR